VEDPGRLTLPVTVAASALIALSLMVVVFAGPISNYTDATAAQLHEPAGYIDILQSGNKQTVTATEEAL
jgi:multicomponent K+:H+ antiporter subunit D